MSVPYILVLVAGVTWFFVSLVLYIVVRKKIKSYGIRSERELIREEDTVFLWDIFFTFAALSIPFWFGGAVHQVILSLISFIIVAITVVGTIIRFNIIAEEAKTWNSKDY